MGLSYRHSEVDPDWIFIRARFRGEPASRPRLPAHIEQIQAAREASQPIRARTGGSTFANPPGHQAWRLIDEAGCRGLTRGGAMVSEKHTNFLINTGNATAADIEGLGEEVRRLVYDRCGIMLEWEIRRIGEPAGVACPRERDDQAHAGCQDTFRPAGAAPPPAADHAGAAPRRAVVGAGRARRAGLWRVRAEPVAGSRQRCLPRRPTGPWRRPRRSAWWSTISRSRAARPPSAR